jgi:acyl dehydratase
LEEWIMIEWFDDLKVGMRFKSSESKTVSKEEILRFAGEFDPQPFHLDDEAAKDTLHLEGEVVELIPSKTKPQGIARVKWTAFNQNGEAVYTFNPIAIVPRRPA